MTVAAENSADASIADSNVYRAMLSIDEVPNIIDRITEQFGSWLREKDWDAPLSASGFHEQAERDLLVLRHRWKDGVAFRGRLVENTLQGTWRTELTAFEPSRGTTWVALEVSNSEGRFVAVPRIAAYLMDTLPTRDGVSLLSSTARLVGSNNVDEVLESIRDPARQGLYLVAATNHADIDFEVFRKQVDKWGKQVRGLAQVVVLNPDATDDMLRAFGASHAVRPWTIRTFAPHVDLSNEQDGLRHKFLSTQRLATDKEQVIVRLLGRVARRHASRRTLPDGFVRVDRALARLEDSLLVDALAAPKHREPPPTAVGSKTQVPVPMHAEHDIEIEETRTPTPTADRDLLRKLDLVKIVLGIDPVTEDRLREIAEDAERGRMSTQSLERIRAELERRQRDIDDLQDRLAATTEDYETAVLDAAIAEGVASDHADETRWLRQRLADLKDFEAAHGAAPQDSRTIYPNDFDELVSRLDELAPRGVVFTGETGGIADLDEYDTLNRAVKLAWDALLTLADYVRARNERKWDLGVPQYLACTPQGFRAVGPSKFAEGETALTMDAYGATRIFPVPTSADPSGRASMQAHFKLGKIGRISPRMHVIDCWPTDGRVYVGYIGPHLPTARG